MPSVAKAFGAFLATDNSKKNFTEKESFGNTEVKMMRKESEAKNLRKKMRKRIVVYKLEFDAKSRGRNVHIYNIFRL